MVHLLPQISTWRVKSVVSYKPNLVLKRWKIVSMVCKMCPRWGLNRRQQERLYVRQIEWTDKQGCFTDALRWRSDDRDSHLEYSCMLGLQHFPSLISQSGLKMHIKDPMFILWSPPPLTKFCMVLMLAYFWAHLGFWNLLVHFGWKMC